MIVPHESEEVVRALVKAFGKVRTVIDVGCGDGYEVSQVDADRRIGIDANPDTPRLFTNVEYFTTAIGASNCRGTLYAADVPGCSSLMNRGGATLITPIERLDTFCDRNDICDVDALIIDTEGTTFDVLEGAGELLESIRYIYAEVQLVHLYPTPMFQEVDTRLKLWGFSRVDNLPSYTGEVQANYLWIRQ